jgi:hypothetical protein
VDLSADQLHGRLKPLSGSGAILADAPAQTAKGREPALAEALPLLALLASGIPSPAVSARLGHGSIRTTQEIYSHMIHGQDEKRRENGRSSRTSRHAESRSRRGACSKLYTTERRRGGQRNLRSNIG